MRTLVVPPLLLVGLDTLGAIARPGRLLQNDASGQSPACPDEVFFWGIARHIGITQETMDSGWIDRLDQASNTDLFRLRSLLDRKLDDPRRILSTRKLLCLGQAVRFVDWRNGDWLTGTVLALRDRELTLRDDSGRQWKLPYVAIEPPSETPDVTAELQSAPAAPRLGREDFAPGDRVSFADKYLQTQMGTVLRINQRTATIKCDDGQWRVGFSLLRHVIDV